MENQKLPRITVFGILGLILLISFGSSMFVTIEPGEKGVLFNKFSGLNKQKIYDQGLKIIAPWNTMHVYDVKINESLLEMLGEEELESKKGPELLAGMLNLGFKGKKDTDYIISSENIKAIPVDKFKWNVSGIIRISDFPNSKEKNKKKKTWSVGFGFSIKEETSRGDKIPFSKISFNENENVTLIEKNNGAKVDVSETKSFSFEGEINLENILGKQDPKRLAINFFTTNN